MGAPSGLLPFLDGRNASSKVFSCSISQRGLILEANKSPLLSMNHAISPPLATRQLLLQSSFILGHISAKFLSP